MGRPEYPDIPVPDQIGDGTPSEEMPYTSLPGAVAAPVYHAEKPDGAIGACVPP